MAFSQIILMYSLFIVSYFIISIILFLIKTFPNFFFVFFQPVLQPKLVRKNRKKKKSEKNTKRPSTWGIFRLTRVRKSNCISCSHPVRWLKHNWKTLFHINSLQIVNRSRTKSKIFFLWKTKHEHVRDFNSSYLNFFENITIRTDIAEKEKWPKLKKLHLTQ